MNAIQPYDSTALADLILRSSDRVDFYVLGAFLRYVSPTFRTMFALNTGPGQVVDDNEKKDGYPVVCLAEDSNTLRLLLDSIYPSSEERCLHDVGLFWKAAKASQKYCMKIIEDKLRKRVLTSYLMIYLILRSSDSVDFFVSGTLIRRLSAVFKGMFPLPPDHEVKNGMPIVRVEDSSQVLHCLISVIHYDLDELDMKDCRLYIKVVQAVRKYRMTTIERRLYKQAANSPLTNSDPLRVYIIAAALGWEELAKTVALNTFYEPLDKLAYVDELRLISGADLYRLMQHRFRCANAASSALEGDPMFPKSGFGQWNVFKNKTSSWVSNDPSSAYTQLKVSPRGSTVSNIYSKHLELDSSKTGKFEMTPTVFFNIVRCARDAEKNVESAVAKVDFAKADFVAKVDFAALVGLFSSTQNEGLNAGG
ncbi:hypothetical protein M378DRAFT_157389 [Amanita muscaria Koide BX008]|uniref:BTB domain-containing protein n=1 Tax=Amanita muscaria (strain Koide BX008) TaxID=946122 RepID=A0A0C2XI63_AMAMK|nr:hypothetical protein M378DRAFT_157389 [Amanita muscaria Koide BX008]